MGTTLSRRALITSGMLAVLGLSRRPSRAGLSLLACDRRPAKDSPPHVLVVIFLRGGVDGLNVCAPYFEDDYYHARPSLGLAAPTDGRANAKERTIDLDGRFGLHPALAPLYPAYASGELAIVHACGSGDQTRSHFEAMATMERGLRDDTGGAAGGWLARHIGSLGDRGAGAMKAVAIGATLPQSLVGATGATAMQDIRDLMLNLPYGQHDAQIQSALNHMYAAQPGADSLRMAGAESLKLLRAISEMPIGTSSVQNGASYPRDDFGHGLSQTATLLRAGIGLEIACLDHMGYDTHVGQGGATGMLAERLASLGQGLAAFRTDLGPEQWARTTVVVQSEFGRRVAENGGLGTDHGRGTVMFVMGGHGVRGGKVWGRWPTLAPDKLEGPGDLPVTTDYRNVLAEVLKSRCGQTASPSAIFPGLDYTPIGITYA